MLGIITSFWLTLYVLWLMNYKRNIFDVPIFGKNKIHNTEKGVPLRVARALETKVNIVLSFYHKKLSILRMFIIRK